MITSFIIFLLIFVLIGVSSSWYSRGTKKDYYLASSSVKPWLVGLSAVATNNSGYMFIGVIGFTYATGLASIWLMIGWITGDFLASLYVHKRLRAATEASGQVSYAGVLSHWHGDGQLSLQRIIGLISLLFLIAYASAQLVAGSKALHVLFDWPLWLGAVLGAVMVALYCFAGGIRASIWTDAAQSIVMISAMSILLLVAVNGLGGIDASIAKMHEVPGFMNWVPSDLVVPGVLGGLIYITGWLFAGFSVIGQPHVMVRFMTLDDNGAMKRAKMWYYLWFSLFYMAATAVGMLSRIYISDASNFDAELALPTMAQMLLPEILVGLILAGVFAATMSTADSLVLSCSATVTHDLRKHQIENTFWLKITTVIIVALALGVALYTNRDGAAEAGGTLIVFNLVIMSWSGLASAFAPLLLSLCVGYRPRQSWAIAALLVGFATALIWRAYGLHADVYEGLPGILAGLLVLLVSYRMSKKS